MKAVFMTQVGGKLMEVERRDIKDANVYYCAVRDPIQLKAMTDVEYAQPAAVKKERWVCHAQPLGQRGFAVFLLDGME